MIARSVGFALALPLVVLAACGGSTSDDGSGGSTSGGSGGSTGGSAGSGASGGSGGSVTGGSGGCAAGGGIDCIDECTGDLYLPDCVNGGWECASTGPCADGGAGGACAADEIPTVDGCLTCDAATKAYTVKIDAAYQASAACNTTDDCVMVPSSTACAGSCPIAVSQSGQDAFAAALSKIDAEYCTGYAAVCGYATPKCPAFKPVCTAGMCTGTI